MKSATKRKIPPIEEQVQALLEMCDDEQLARVVRIVQEHHSAWLDRRSEEARPPSVPSSWMRRMYDARANGCLCNAVALVLKENG
jgi:hypothetical protein